VADAGFPGVEVVAESVVAESVVAESVVAESVVALDRPLAALAATVRDQSEEKAV
jgi:hypothetical protein